MFCFIVRVFYAALSSSVHLVKSEFVKLLRLRRDYTIVCKRYALIVNARAPIKLMQLHFLHTRQAHTSVRGTMAEGEWGEVTFKKRPMRAAEARSQKVREDQKTIVF